MLSTPTTIDHLIIGAGPAGLAMAGRMRQAGMNFTIVEKTDRVGDRWHRHYDRLHLHSVKQWSHLPHLPFPDDYPVYVPRQKFIEYFEQYVKHFNIQPQFNVEVNSIRKAQDGIWEVTTDSDVIHTRHVTIATGLNRIPNKPTWPGMGAFEGSIVHSIDYKNPESYSGSRVLVIGMGNTGAEIALDLAEAGIPVWISVRESLTIVPRDLNGKPVQETAKILARLPFGLGDWLGARVQRLYFGNLKKYGIKQSEQYPAVELRETGKTPVIDIGTVQAIKQGKIQVVKGVQRFRHDGVVLENGQQLLCEHVILATGYRPRLQDIVEGIEPFLDKFGYPKRPVGSGSQEGLFFVGFDNYQLGGVLGTIYNDSEVVLKYILGKSNEVK